MTRQRVHLLYMPTEVITVHFQLSLTIGFGVTDMYFEHYQSSKHAQSTLVVSKFAQWPPVAARAFRRLLNWYSLLRHGMTFVRVFGYAKVNTTKNTMIIAQQI